MNMKNNIIEFNPILSGTGNKYCKHGNGTGYGDFLFGDGLYNGFRNGNGVGTGYEYANDYVYIHSIFLEKLKYNLNI